MKTPIKNFSKERVRTLLCILTIIAVTSSSCTKSENIEDQNLKNVSKPATTSGVDNTITNRLLPPSSVRSFFNTSPNPAVSDDFNDAQVDMTKWQYRNNNPSTGPIWGLNSSYVYISTNGTQKFLSLKGNYAEKKGSGISTRVATKYGFYIAKWKLSGIEANSESIWHPAIWGGPCDYTNNSEGNCIPERSGSKQWLEADLMETYEGPAPVWGSHLLQWNTNPNPLGSTVKVTMIPRNNNLPSSPNWEIIGMEYRPTYIKMWRFNWTTNSWVEVHSVPINEDPRSTNNMNINNRTPLYWILSNRLMRPGVEDSDSWLHVDYFYHYDYIGPVN